MLPKNEIGKRVFALAFLILLLSIQAVKILHTHAPSAINKTLSDKNLKQVVVSEAATVHACNICDYKLTKDADFSLSPVIVNKNVSFVVYNTTFTSLKALEAFSSFVSRGPPTII